MRAVPASFARSRFVVRGTTRTDWSSRVNVSLCHTMTGVGQFVPASGRPQDRPTRSRHVSPSVLAIKGGGPLFKAGFRQGKIVVAMGDEPGQIPASGVRPSNDDESNPLARAQRQRRHRSKEAVLIESIDRAHEAEDSTAQLGSAAQVSASDAVTQNQFPEQTSVTPILVFRAMAHQRDMARAGEPLDETQSEFLSVILDAAAARIDGPVHEQFGSVPASKLGPRESASLTSLEEPLARSQGRHPDVVAARRHTAATKARCQNPKTIGLSVDRTPHRFGLEHQVRISFRVSVSPTAAHHQRRALIVCQRAVWRMRC